MYKLVYENKKISAYKVCKTTDYEWCYICGKYACLVYNH